jgi:hypothetical protein
MNIDNIIWGSAVVAVLLFVADLAALVYLVSICPLINCLN